MKFTTKHKTYAAVLGLAVAAFGANCVFGGNTTQSEMPAVAEMVNAVVSTTASQAFASDNTTLADRLQMIDQTMVSHNVDAFAPANIWNNAVATTQASTHTAASEFVKTHTISAVMQSTTGGEAIINGKLVKVGGQIDGFTLVSVRKNVLVMENASGRFGLKFNERSVS